MKNVLYILSLVFLSSLLLGFHTVQCAQADTRTITDMSGREATVPLNISRVAVLTSPCVQIMYMLGDGDRLCAITVPNKQSWLLKKLDPRIGNMPAPRRCIADISVEELLKTRPDVCMGSFKDMAVVEKHTDIPALRVFTPRTNFEKQKKEVMFFGKVLGKNEQAAGYCAYFEETVDFLKSKTSSIPKDKRLKVFLGFGPRHLTTYGGDTYMQERIAAAGCINAAESIKTISGKEGGLRDVSMEHLLAWDPDIIIIDYGQPEEVLGRSQWASLSAVKHKRVYRLPYGIFMWNRPSAEAAVLFPHWLARLSYPELFGGYDIEAQIKDFYVRIFHYCLTDEDVGEMLYPKINQYAFKGKKK